MKISLKNSLILVLLTFSLTFIANCSGNEVDAKNDAKAKNKHIVSVEIQNLKGEEFTDFITVIGTVQPINKAKLGYLTGGKIKKFISDKGAFVNKGDTIVIIDNDILKANYDAAKARYDLALITYQKQERIFKENVNSEFQLLQSKSAFEQAKANLDLTKAQLEDTFITAPFSGIIDAKYYENGELVVPGTPIVNLINTAKMKLEAGVPEKYAQKVYVGIDVIFNINEISLNNLSAKITYVGSSINVNNRTFPIEVEFNSSNGALKPEMIAELNIASEHYENLITIPENVISRTEIGDIVYIAENGVARKRKIEILSRKGSSVAIKSGLNTGDKLITVGYHNLLEGQAINIMN